MHIQPAGREMIREWLAWPGFAAGAIGTFLYGWYIAVRIVPLCRFFGAEQAR